MEEFRLWIGGLRKISTSELYMIGGGLKRIRAIVGGLVKISTSDLYIIGGDLEEFRLSRYIRSDGTWKNFPIFELQRRGTCKNFDF